MEKRRMVMSLPGGKSMKRFFGVVVAVLIVVLLIGPVGCGSANNDQGMAFTFLGYFQEAGDRSGEIPEGLAGISVPLSDTVNQEARSGQHGGALTAFVGLQNNLAGQYIRVKRIYYTYSIAGAAIQPPDTSLPMSGIIGPGETNQEEGDVGVEVDSSMPDTFMEDAGPRYYVETFLVPPAVMSWLSFNRDSLPEAPFTMVVTAQVEGIASGADVLRTNREDIFVNFLPDNMIPPIAGSDNEAAGDSATADAENVAVVSDSEENNSAGADGVDLWSDIAKEVSDK